MVKKNRETLFHDFEGKHPIDKHIRITDQMLKNTLFKTLSPSAFKLYCYMKHWAQGRREFDYAWSLAKNMSLFGSNKTFIRAKNELINKGFIECTRTQICGSLPNRYKFSSKWYK